MPACRRRSVTTVHSEGEADAGGGLAAEAFGEAVVATAAAHGVLCVLQCGGRELERGAGVVVQPADELRGDLVGNTERFQPGADGSEVFGGLGRQMVDHERRTGDDGGVLLALAVEDPERILLERLERCS